MNIETKKMNTKDKSIDKEKMKKIVDHKLKIKKAKSNRKKRFQISILFIMAIAILYLLDIL